MASTVGPSPPSDRRLSIESLPTVDLRLLSQSELTALSLCSSHAFDLRRCDDVVIPKIDRSVFNESAGSRKQTYSRLRLAPRNRSTTALTPKPPPSLDSDNSRIISLFKRLFNNEGAEIIETKYESFSSALVPVNVEYSEVLLSGGDRKRRRGGQVSEGMLDVSMVTRDEEKDKDTEKEKEKELVNKNGEIVDLKELGKKEDPFGEEIRKRTEGKESPEELLGFITDLDGQWGSRRKKRKIVDANVFGDSLPNGWKVLIAMKKKQGRAWVFCRRYISPNGRHFVSCKEVSSYLLSLTSPEDVKQHLSIECLEDAVADNKLASESAGELGYNVENCSLSIATQSNDQENFQKLFSTSETTDSEKQVGVLTNVPLGGQAASAALKCHKCSTTFVEKDELLKHLVSCHKRKRRKSGAPIEDDILMRDGKYECQFCSKVFNERSCYFGHVGIHVKNYVKSIGGSPSLTSASKRKDSVLTVTELPAIVSEVVRDVEMNADSVSSIPKILAGEELNFKLADSKPEAGCEAGTHIEYSEIVQNDVELSMETAQNCKIAADESSDEFVGTAHTTKNNVREVEGGVDFPVMKPDTLSGTEEINDYENIDLCENLGEINRTDCTDFEIIKASPKSMENDVTDFVSDSKQADLGNDSNFSVSLLQREGETSESDLLTVNKETTPDDQAKDRSLVNTIVEQSCFTEGLELGDDDRLMGGSDSGHLDLGIDVVDDVQFPGSLDDTSDNLHNEEGAYGITVKRIELMESPVVESNENGSCSLTGDQPTTDMQNFEGEILIGVESGTEVDTCGLEDIETIVDTEISVAQEQPEACAAVQSKKIGFVHVFNEDETAASMKLVEHEEIGGFHVEQTCSIVNSPRELSSRKCEQPKSERVMNFSSLFIAPDSKDSHLDRNDTHSNVSNLLGPFDKFVENKQEDVPKNIFSDLSLNQHMCEVSMNNTIDAPSATASMQLPELDKVDCSRTNKLIFDFGSITDMNPKFLGSVQSGTMTEGASPFSLWGQQLCTVENNQNRVYGNARQASQQERSLDNNSHNSVGLQQPSDVGYNLNKICMNEQRYSIQHNETGVYRKSNEVEREGLYSSANGFVQQERVSDRNSLNIVGLQQPSNSGFNLNKVHMNEQRYGVQHNESGVYRKNSDARTEGMSHGNTLNLAGFQQQCDNGYNLNKSSVNQQSYGMQYNETGAYSTADESKQERVTYGNSLSLASVPQTCEQKSSMNKACIPQTCDMGFGINKEYVGAMQELSRLDELEHSRDRDLMIGFGNNGGRPDQNVATDFVWRAAEGNIVPGGLMDTSSSRGQSSGSYQAFDFLSDKGGNDMYVANDKFENISSFEGLRPNTVVPMEFSFMTPQDSNLHLGHKNVVAFNTQINQGFGSSVWHQKPTLPNMMAGQFFSTLCVWCGNEFHQDSLSCEMQAGSIGYLCPTCKARMSGQFL